MTTQLINIENKNGVAVVSSRVVAKDFGKRHSDVITKIEGKVRPNGVVENGLIQGIEDVREIPSNYFIKNEYLDSYGRLQAEYLLTRDGFSLLVYGTFENPLFLAKDVAEWIEHSNPSKMLKSVDEDEKVKRILGITYSYGNGFRTRKQEALFLTEDGLYEALMQSRKPIANG